MLRSAFGAVRDWPKFEGTENRVDGSDICSRDITALICRLRESRVLDIGVSQPDTDQQFKIREFNASPCVRRPPGAQMGANLPVKVSFPPLLKPIPTSLKFGLYSYCDARYLPTSIEQH